MTRLPSTPEAEHMRGRSEPGLRNRVEEEEECFGMSSVWSHLCILSKRRILWGLECPKQIPTVLTIPIYIPYASKGENSIASSEGLIHRAWRARSWVDAATDCRSSRWGASKRAPEFCPFAICGTLSRRSPAMGKHPNIAGQVWGSNLAYPSTCTYPTDHNSFDIGSVKASKG
jgi:hypothetical protein